MPEDSQTKKCGKCEKTKLVSEFYRKKKTGKLRSPCKKCQRLMQANKYERVHGKQRFYIERPRKQADADFEQVVETQEEYRGIESWEQVESVVRALAELQYAIDQNMNEGKRKAAKIKQVYRDYAEPSEIHKLGLTKMLKDFIKKHHPNGDKFFRRYTFGTISCKKGRLLVIPDAKLAGERMDRP